MATLLCGYICWQCKGLIIYVCNSPIITFTIMFIYVNYYYLMLYILLDTFYFFLIYYKKNRFILCTFSFVLCKYVYVVNYFQELIIILHTVLYHVSLTIISHCLYFTQHYGLWTIRDNIVYRIIIIYYLRVCLQLLFIIFNLFQLV